MRNFLFYPDEAVGREGLNTEEAIKLMGEDDEKEEEPIKLEESKEEESKEDDKADEEDEKEDEKDELDELEEELEGPDDEKLELTTPVSRREILKKYPDVFKDFPYLEKAYYREQQFTEILSTIEEAKEAVNKANVLDQFDNDIKRGNLEKTIRTAKAHGDDSFNSLVDNYLPNLAKVDKDAYHHVVGNIVKMTISTMLSEAKASGNEELQDAARILNHFIFATHTITPPSNLSKEKTGTDTARDELQAQRNEILKEKFESSRDEINSKISNVLKSTISANIDPKSSMTDYVRKNASREAQEHLEKMLGDDKRLGIIIDKLWEQAFREKLSRPSLDKIKSAYLTRAKMLLPTAIKQARNDALRGMGKRVKEEDEEAGPKKGPLPAGNSTSSSRSESKKSYSDKAKDIPANMSSFEYLMKD